MCVHFSNLQAIWILFFHRCFGMSSRNWTTKIRLGLRNWNQNKTINFTHVCFVCRFEGNYCVLLVFKKDRLSSFVYESKQLNQLHWYRSLVTPASKIVKHFISEYPFTELCDVFILTHLSMSSWAIVTSVLLHQPLAWFFDTYMSSSRSKLWQILQDQD